MHTASSNQVIQLRKDAEEPQGVLNREDNEPALALIEEVYRYTRGALLGVPIHDRHLERMTRKGKIIQDTYSALNDDTIIRTTIFDPDTGRIERIVVEIIYNEGDFGIVYDRVAYCMEIKTSMVCRLRKLLNSTGISHFDALLSGGSEKIVFSKTKGTYSHIAPKVIEESEETLTISHDRSAVHQKKYYGHCFRGNHRALSYHLELDITIPEMPKASTLLRCVNF